MFGSRERATATLTHQEGSASGEGSHRALGLVRVVAQGARRRRPAADFDRSSRGRLCRGRGGRQLARGSSWRRGGARAQLQGCTNLAERRDGVAAAAQGNQRGGASGGGGLGFVGGQGLGMGFPEGRGVLLIGRRGGSRRACPRDGRAKSPAEMRLRCERRGEGVGADMRARRGSGRAGRVRDERVAGAARAGAGSGKRWATRGRGSACWPGEQEPGLRENGPRSG